MPDSQHPTRSPWRQWLHNWITRGQTPSPSQALGHRNIYVLPSAAGCMLAATLLVLLVASINFQLNLGYLLTFLIAGSALASVWVGHRNLQGLQLHLGPLQPVFQGERATVPLHLQAPVAGPHRHGLSVALNRSQGPLAWVHADVAAGHTQVVELGSVLQVFTQPQQPITYSLIDEIVPQELPQGVLQRVQALSQKLPASASGQLLRLSYAGASAYEPVLSHLIRELGLDLSILHGQIDEIQGETFGSLAVFAEGPASQIAAAVAYLQAQGVQVRVQQEGTQHV